jgi:hypothetical protein
MNDETKRKREAARESFRPPQIRFLFVAESPPSALERFFYFHPVRIKDGLFVETMKVLYAVSDVPNLREQKPAYLERFKHDEFFLVDAVDMPIPQGSSSSAKRKAVLAALPRLKVHLKKLCTTPKTKVVLIGKSSYGIHDVLRQDGFNVINTEMIDLPVFGRASLFREKLGRLLDAHDASGQRGTD